MYRSNRQQLEFPDFYLPFSGQLDPENRWVKLAKLVPWGLAEEIYHADLCEDFGAPVIPSRVALGALIIKERLRLPTGRPWKRSARTRTCSSLLATESFLSIVRLMPR